MARRLRDVGIDDPETLLALGTGASLSDQHWLREEGASLTWNRVSFFSNDFGLRLGQYLTAQDSQSAARLAAAIARDLGIATRSPDSSLGGNLPKRWEIHDGIRMLVKRSSSAYGQEPMNEVLASRLCERLGIAHVPYTAQRTGDGNRGRVGVRTRTGDENRGRVGVLSRSREQGTGWCSISASRTGDGLAFYLVAVENRGRVGVREQGTGWCSISWLEHQPVPRSCPVPALWPGRT